MSHSISNVIMCVPCVRYYYMLFILFATTSNTASAQQYRLDYVYSAKADAFYKIHTNEVSYAKASSICGIEGAVLLFPVLEHDIVQAHAMLKDYPDLGNFVWVTNDGNSHESAEEPALINLECESSIEELESSNEKLERDDRCTVLTRRGRVKSTHCNYTLPFICKVAAKDAYYDRKCGVFSRGYQYVESLGSCYKIPRIAYTWNQAYAECRAEGAHLVILNSEEESLFLKTVMKLSRFIPDSYCVYYYIAGIRTNHPTDGTPRVFRTTFNQTLEEAGFSKWAATEPNNIDGREDCGSLFEGDGRYNDHDCDRAYGFICESEVRTLRTLEDY